MLQRGNFSQSSYPIKEVPLCFSYIYERLFYEARVFVDEGRQMNNKEFKNISHKKMITSKCFTIDSSKLEKKPFVGSASIDM
jgi:hypothetical protein